MHDADDDLPPPHPSFVLYRVLVEAIVAELAPKKATRFLEVIATKLADEENLTAVFPIRQSSQREAQRRAHAQASALYRRCLPIFLARVGKR